MIERMFMLLHINLHKLWDVGIFLWYDQKQRQSGFHKSVFMHFRSHHPMGVFYGERLHRYLFTSCSEQQGRSIH